ncbi:MAG: FKBP-type peptidyl-prolyl cis-trans isomerase [Bacterioplanes sp.]|nr:FKBP-type peptidyl-prolyl cis-trans isomerase [Bacterioplanes sp.]
MTYFSTLSAVVLGSFLLAGCGQEAPVKLDSHVDQVSYGIGLNIGRQLAQDPIDLNVAALAAGIEDIMNNAQQRVDDDVLEQAFAKVRADQERKARALNDEMAAKSAEFLADNAQRDGVMVTESGLQYEVLVAADADQPQPKATDTVRVHYHGTLIDGSVFDSSVQRDDPAQFPVNGVIPGWIEALQLMRVGDKWKLTIPSELAYGARSPSPRIPANSALVFEVELLDIVN